MLAELVCAGVQCPEDKFADVRCPDDSHPTPDMTTHAGCCHTHVSPGSVTSAGGRPIASGDPLLVTGSCLGAEGGPLLVTGSCLGAEG